MQTVSANFKVQLDALMQTIKRTSPHFVRCIKPNEEKLPDLFDRLQITRQLNYCGVVDAVRVARAGFPIKMTFENFYRTYAELVNVFNEKAEGLLQLTATSTIDASVVTDLVECVFDDFYSDSYKTDIRYKISMLWKLEDGLDLSGDKVKLLQIGTTKVFMKTTPFDFLEGRRARLRALNNKVALIQKVYRGFQARNIFRVAYLFEVVDWNLLNANVTKIQRVYRRFSAKIRLRRLFVQSINSAVHIQKLYRGFQARNSKMKFADVAATVMTLQEFHRKELSSEEGGVGFMYRILSYFSRKLFGAPPVIPATAPSNAALPPTELALVI